MGRRKVYRGVGGLKLDVVGAVELINAFKALDENAVYKLTNPSIAAANVVLKKAKDLVPVDSGDLKQKLKVRNPTKASKRAYRITAQVAFPRSVAYGVPLELGHNVVVKGNKTGQVVRARPYLRPAADQSKDEVAAIMGAAMSNIVREAGQL